MGDHEEEIDLYDDIFLPVCSEAHTNGHEVTKPSESLGTVGVSSAELLELKELTSQLMVQNTALKKNISCLYKTAQQELQRKESLIERLMKRVKWLERDLRKAQAQSNKTITSDSSPIEIATNHKTSEHSNTSKDEYHPTKVLITQQKERDYREKDTQRSTRCQIHESSESGSKDQLCHTKSQNSTEHHISKTSSKPKDPRPTEYPIHKRRLSREDHHFREEHQRRERKEHLLKRDKENHHHLRRSERKRKLSVSPSRTDKGDLREKLEKKRFKQEPTSKTKSTENCNIPEIEVNTFSYEELIEEDLLELEYDEPYSAADPLARPPPSSNSSTITEDIQDKDITNERSADNNSDIVEQSTPPPSKIKDNPPPCVIQAISKETETELEDGEIEDGEIEDSEDGEITEASQDSPIDKLTCHSKEHKSGPRHSSFVRTHKQGYHSQERRKMTDRRGHDDRRRSGRNNDLYSTRDSRRH